MTLSAESEAMAAMKTVFTALARRDLAASMQVWAPARAGLAHAQGAVRLALLEGLADALDAFLTELGEHGRENEALWGIEREQLDVQALSDELQAVWKELTTLRESGLSSEALIAPYVRGSMTEIGSMEWFDQTRRGIRHRCAPEHLARLKRRFTDEPFAEEDGSDQQ